jgi:hypothetical protein
MTANDIMTALTTFSGRTVPVWVQQAAVLAKSAVNPADLID